MYPVGVGGARRRMTGDGVPPDPTPAASGATRLQRRVLGPLAAYHAMILVGAALIVEGRLRGYPFWFDLGGALAAAGILLEILILRWTYRLAASAARRPGRADLNAPASPSAPIRLCVSCAWQGTSAAAYCPRCGRVGLVRTYVERPDPVGSS